MFGNKQIIIIINLILFSSGQGAEKKKKRYKVVAFPTLLTMIVGYIKIHLKSPYLSQLLLTWCQWSFSDQAREKTVKKK